MKEFLSDVDKMAHERTSSSQGLWERLRVESQNLRGPRRDDYKPHSSSNETSESVSRSPRRIMNPRNAGRGRGTGTASGKPLNKLSKDSSTREKSSKSSIEESILFDVDHYKDLVDRGFTLESGPEDDPFDHFIDEVFIDSFKTKENSVNRVIVTPSFSRTILPKPRPMRSILDSLEPKIVAEAGSEGTRLARQAWTGLAKNYFYNDHDKQHVVNLIARRTNVILRKVEEFDEKVGRGEAQVDRVFEDSFRRIPERFDRDRHDPSDDTDVIEVVSDTEFGQDDTNWETEEEAVVDEDELV